MSRIHRILFYILLIALPTQLGLHFWPSWSMILGRRVDYLSPTLYFTDVIIVTLLISWLAATIGKIKKITFPYRILIPTMIFFVFVAVTMFTSSSRPVAVYSWIKFFEFFLLAWYMIKTRPPFEKIVFFLSTSVLYSSVIAIVQFLLQHSLGGIFWWLGERTFTAATPGIAQIPLCLTWVSGCPLVLRAYGIFPHPNVLGGYLAVLLPLLLYKATNLQSNKLRGQKLVYIITIICAIIALFLTFSRGAWAVGAIGMGLSYGLFRIKRISPLPVFRNTKYVIPGIFFIVFILSVFLPNILGDSESVVVRKQLNDSAFSMITRSPIVGVGPGNFLVRITDAIPSRGVYILQPVHNIYLLLLSETGIIGILIIGIFISGFIKSQKKKHYSPLAVLCLILILLLGFTDHYPLTLQQGQLLLTLCFSLLFLA